MTVATVTTVSAWSYAFVVSNWMAAFPVSPLVRPLPVSSLADLSRSAVDPSVTGLAVEGHLMVVTGGLRERARRAVRAEAVQAAMELFKAQGFEATTVDQIAQAAGMSKSSFFRYFPSKEDLVVASFDTVLDALVEALRAQPLDEPAWDALRHGFEAGLGPYMGSFPHQPGEILKLVLSSPALSAAWLQRLNQVEERSAELLLERAAERGERAEAGEVLTRATVGAAWACLRATFRAALASEGPSSGLALLGSVMDALRPGAQGAGRGRDAPGQRPR